mmetsp:Transcript_58270/g.109838  ORF Transcript_58270/g.109838 Transcript_58270/m.109838 type:complete len:1245 (+) Transcript_58270:54-3788(+)
MGDAELLDAVREIVSKQPEGLAAGPSLLHASAKATDDRFANVSLAKFKKLLIPLKEASKQQGNPIASTPKAELVAAGPAPSKADVCASDAPSAASGAVAADADSNQAADDGPCVEQDYVRTQVAKHNARIQELKEQSIGGGCQPMHQHTATADQMRSKMESRRRLLEGKECQVLSPSIDDEERSKDTDAMSEDDEEAAEDVDPFEMMGGMGAEEIYQVTLLKENCEEQEEVKDAEVVPDEEEEAAGDVDDPFEMMGGMGAEEVYKVTLLREAAATQDSEEVEAVAKQCEETEEAAGDVDEASQKVNGLGTKEVVQEQAKRKDASDLIEEEELEEEEAAIDLDDPFELMGKMGAEEVYKVTLLEQAGEEQEEQVEASGGPQPAPEEEQPLTSEARAEEAEVQALQKKVEDLKAMPEAAKIQARCGSSTAEIAESSSAAGPAPQPSAEAEAPAVAAQDLAVAGAADLAAAAPEWSGQEWTSADAQWQQADWQDQTWNASDSAVVGSVDVAATPEWSGQGWSENDAPHWQQQEWQHSDWNADGGAVEGMGDWNNSNTNDSNLQWGQNSQWHDYGQSGVAGGQEWQADTIWDGSGHETAGQVAAMPESVQALAHEEAITGIMKEFREETVEKEYGRLLQTCRACEATESTTKQEVDAVSGHLRDLNDVVKSVEGLKAQIDLATIVTERHCKGTEASETEASPEKEEKQQHQATDAPAAQPAPPQEPVFDPWADMTEEVDPAYASTASKDYKEQDWKEAGKHDWQAEKWAAGDWNDQDDSSQWHGHGDSWKGKNDGRETDVANDRWRGGGRQRRDEQQDWQRNNGAGRQREKRWDNANSDYSGGGQRKQNSGGKNDWWSKSTQWQEDNWQEDAHNQWQEGGQSQWQQEEDRGQGSQKHWQRGEDQWPEGRQERRYNEEERKPKGRAAESRVMPDGIAYTYRDFMNWAVEVKAFKNTQEARDYFNSCPLEDQNKAADSWDRNSRGDQWQDESSAAWHSNDTGNHRTTGNNSSAGSAGHTYGRSNNSWNSHWDTSKSAGHDMEGSVADHGSARGEHRGGWNSEIKWAEHPSSAAGASSDQAEVHDPWEDMQHSIPPAPVSDSYDDGGIWRGWGSKSAPVSSAPVSSAPAEDPLFSSADPWQTGGGQGQKGWRGAQKAAYTVKDEPAGKWQPSLNRSARTARGRHEGGDANNAREWFGSEVANPDPWSSQWSNSGAQEEEDTVTATPPPPGPVPPMVQDEEPEDENPWHMLG